MQSSLTIPDSRSPVAGPVVGAVVGAVVVVVTTVVVATIGGFDSAAALSALLEESCSLAIHGAVLYNLDSKQRILLRKLWHFLQYSCLASIIVN